MQERASNGQYKMSPAALAQRRANMTARERTGLYRSRTAIPEPDRRKLMRFEHELWDLLPWLKESDASTVRSFCFLLLLRDKITAALGETGLVNEDGQITRLTEELRRTLSTLLRYSESLGLTPKARLEMGLTAAETGRAQAAVEALLAKGASQ